MRILDDEVAPADYHSVLDLALRLHAAPTPRSFVTVLARELGSLIPYEHADWGDLVRAGIEVERDEFAALLHGVPGPRTASPPLEPVPSPEHRLALSIATGSRVLGFVLLRMRTRFARRDRVVADLLQPHLGAAFDHVRLRAADSASHRSLPSLTVREQEVLALVADGRTNRDIATTLVIEPRTVEKHVENIRAKLGARSRAEAAAKWARSAGMVRA